MIKVAITDDESLVASSLATLLSLEPDFEVVTVCASGEELLEWWKRQSRQIQPDALPAEVLVCDLQLGGIDGIETARRLLGLAADVKILIVTSHAKPGALKRALQTGVNGFLPKTADTEEFSAAIRALKAGRRYLDAEVAALAISGGDSTLTERETELLELAGRGLTIEEIASAAHLAPGTCRNYLSNAMTKLGASNRFEAYNLAEERGWL